MERVFFLFIVMLVLTGCSAESSMDSTSEIVQVSPTIARSAAPTPSPTLKGTPTVDYLERIGETDLKLHQSVASATLAGITQQVIDTAQARLDIANGKTGTVSFSKTQTFVAQAVQTQDRAATGTAQAPITEREWVRTSWEPVIWAAFLGVMMLVGAFVCWSIYALTYAKYNLMMAQANLKAQPKTPEVKAPEKTTTEPAIVQLDMRDEYGWGAVEWSTLPISKDVLRKVAELIVQHGARYTQVQMTGAGKPLIKNNTFESFGAWMQKNKIAFRLNDGRYEIQQPTFFRQVLNE